MFTRLAAAVIAAACSVASAHAEPMYLYGSIDSEFSTHLGQCYQQAPAGLRNRMLNARFTVVEDTATFVRVAQYYGSAKAAASNAAGQFEAYTMQGDSQTIRSMMFVQSKMIGKYPIFHCLTVLHEMFHLFDFGAIGVQKSFSDDPVFRSAYDADKVAYQKWLAWLYSQNKDSSALRARVDYFFSKPQEAFAEAGARIIINIPDDFAGLRDDFNHALPRVSAHMSRLFGQMGIYK